MNICFIDFEIFAECGGCGNVTYQIALELGKVGNNVHIVSFSKNTGVNITQIGHNVTLYEFPYHVSDRTNSIKNSLYYFIANIHIYQKLLDICPDIIVDQTHSSVFPCYMCYCKSHIPYCVAIHGEPLLSPILSMLQKFRFGRKLQPHLPHLVAVRKYITVIDQLVPIVTRYYSQKPIVIPNGIDREIFKPPKNKRLDNRSFPSILIASRLVREKGVSDAILAMLEITKHYPNAQLVILGDGSFRVELEKLVSSLHLEHNVVFVGFITHDAIVSYYQQSTLYLLPSWSEAFPLVIFEAMSCGLPIVATNVGNVSDVVKEENGIVVPIKSPAKIAEGVCKILSMSNEDYDKMSKANIVDTVKHGWDKVAKQYNELFLSIISENKSLQPGSVMTTVIKSEDLGLERGRE